MTKKRKPVAVKSAVEKVEAKESLEQPVEQARLNKPEITEMQKDRRIVVLRDKEKRPMKISKAGRSRYLKSMASPSIVRFLSARPELKVYLEYEDHTEQITFKDSYFYTDNQFEIESLRGHESFGKEIFEGNFPQKILDRRKDDRKLTFTQSDMELMPGF